VGFVNVERTIAVVIGLGVLLFAGTAVFPRTFAGTTWLGIAAVYLLMGTSLGWSACMGAKTH
jgi:hypothetical protein